MQGDLLKLYRHLYEKKSDNELLKIAQKLGWWGGGVGGNGHFQDIFGGVM